MEIGIEASGPQSLYLKRRATWMKSSTVGRPELMPYLSDECTCVCAWGPGTCCSQSRLHGGAAYAGAQSPTLTRSMLASRLLSLPYSLQYCFNKGTLHFHFALSPMNYVADPASNPFLFSVL